MLQNIYRWPSIYDDKHKHSGVIDEASPAVKKISDFLHAQNGLWRKYSSAKAMD